MPEGFRITRMYHPSFHAPDLDEIEAWFARVFGCQSTNIYETFKVRHTGSYPTNYSTFTPMADVLMDTIAPTLYVLNGVQQYASVDKPHLKTIGWFAENSEGGVPLAARGTGSRWWTSTARPPRARTRPGRPAGGDAARLHRARVGRAAPRGAARLPVRPRPPQRARLDGGGGTEAPLGLQWCAFHTLLTDDPRRALHALVDALGGTVFHAGRDEVIGAAASYVAHRRHGAAGRGARPGHRRVCRLDDDRAQRHLPLAHLQGGRPRPGRRAPEVPGRGDPFQDRGHAGDRPGHTASTSRWASPPAWCLATPGSEYRPRPETKAAGERARP